MKRDAFGRVEFFLRRVGHGLAAGKTWWRRFLLSPLAGALLAPAFVLDLNEAPGVAWPSTSTLEAAPLTRDRATAVRVALDSYCFFNHPSLRTGTVLRGTAKLLPVRDGRHFVMVRATHATMRDGREVTFAERQWTVEVPANRSGHYVLPKGTRLSAGRLVEAR